MKNHGFTLLEVLLTIVLLSIIGTVLGPILTNAVQGSTLIWNRRATLAEANAGMERMVREIRLIPSINALDNISATYLQFQYPIGTSISYSLNGTNLLRNSDILITHVSSLDFTYYDESGNAAIIATNVRSIGIQFTASSLTLKTRVFLPNTGHDYASFRSP